MYRIKAENTNDIDENRNGEASGPEEELSAFVRIETETCKHSHQTEQSSRDRKQPEPLSRALLKLGIKIAFVAVVLFLLLTFVGGVFIIHTNDMYPSVRDGDLLITFKITEYHEGDVIAYKHGDNVCFGRVVAEGGDEVVIGDDGEFYLNGTMQLETIYYKTYPREDAQITYPYVVPPGELFVLSDMREQGFDSRVFGATDQPLGKVVLILRRRGF